MSLLDPYKGTKLMFCDILGDQEVFFPLLPRKCFDGRWGWLRPVWRRLCVLKPSIGTGPSEPWWQYAIAQQEGQQ